MNAYLDAVAGQVRQWDGSRDRTRQQLPGWSNMGDCRAYLGFKVRGDWPSDDDDNWRAVVGTVLHDWITVRRVQAVGAAGQHAEFGSTVSYRGVQGHPDEVNWSEKCVTDWKFPRLASARVWDDPDVQAEKFIQPHGYAAAVIPDGEDDLWTVRVLVAPVDGSYGDWAVYEQPFSRQVADDAVDRYEAVQEAVRAGEDLPRDKPYSWCERFCEFFSQCRGDLQGDYAPLPLITDEETATALERYGQLSDIYHDAGKARDELKPLLQGVRGQARGWKVLSSRPGQPKEVLDEEAAVLLLQLQGLEVPRTMKPGSRPYLIVKREKS